MDNISVDSGTLLRILDISRRMAESRVFEALLVYIIDQTIKLIGAEYAYIVLVGPDQSLDFRVTRDRRGQPIAHAEEQISGSVLREVIDRGQALIIRNALSDWRFRMSRSVIELQLRSIMCVPLISFGKTIGAIYVENRSASGRFGEESLAPLIIFANQAAVAIENAVYHDQLEARVAERTRELEASNAQLERSRQELEARLAELEALHVRVHELSIRDSLTHLYNRRYIDPLVRQMFAEARRYQRPFALALADVDGFHHINDTLSHAIGDMVLEALGQIFPAAIRASDVVGCWSSAEFIVLLPEASPDEGVAVGERIRAAVEGHVWSAIHPDLHVTVSLGVAGDGPYESAEAMLRAADRLLLAAKQQGRNRTLGMSPEPTRS